MEREANLPEFKSYELLWINLSSGKTEFGHFWPRCLYSSDWRHWYLTESGLELQLSSGSDSLGDCGLQHRKIPNGCKAISLWKWDFTISGSDWLIPPQISVILFWSVSKFALLFNHSNFKYAWVVRPAGYSSARIFLGEERQGDKMRNTSSITPTESTNSLHFCQIAHAEKNNDWEMSVFGLWELQGEMFPNLYLKLLELFLLLICLSTPLRWNSDKNITFDPKWLVGENIFSSFQFVNTLLTTRQNIQWTKTTPQTLFY